MPETTGRWKRIRQRFSGKEEKKPLPKRYRRLQRNIAVLMILVTVIPLTLLAVTNAMQYQKNIKAERITPMRAIASKAAHSFELFLEERLSALHFIASSYSFKILSDQATMHRIFRILREEYGGYVDLGLINSKGRQITYTGPYDLLNKDYSNQQWFNEARVRGRFISDVFMGYRDMPHIALAVQNLNDQGESWVLRATMDTKKFQKLISPMGLDPVKDAFIINSKGILQTDSRLYGKVLTKCPLQFPEGNSGTQVKELTDQEGRNIVMIYAPLVKYDFALVMILPQASIFKAWHSLRQEISYVFIVSLVLIILVIFSSTHLLVKRIREADEKREIAFRELEYTQKLSSIGRLAAGVAHEINNPLSIINEKAGLMKDLVEHDMHHDKEKLMRPVNQVLHSVDRCRDITHRLLGFARRMGVQYETLDANEVLKETLGFLEKEAHHRDIHIEYNFSESIPQISSDRGQLQQVFLNILSNAFAAVDDGGRIVLSTWEKDKNSVAVSIQDNGHGMSEETLRQIFEPFFTTKKGYGTGLGLPITYGIVKKLGGDIKVNSKVGEGTTFTIFIPKQPPGDTENEQSYGDFTR
ncbi:MAG: two-component sensor histidine kinase [Desulfobacteraceae bacterium]|nr:two-component sensor histidine kinase [Desulfobacteraceae bacterium]